MKKMILFILSLIFCNSYSNCELCKIRLPEHINNYSPQILPVITFDGKYLYFDRKAHPENFGGLKDLDDIWFSEFKNNKFWTIPKPLSISINDKNSNVLFFVSPDGKHSLVYGKYAPYQKEGYYLFSRNDNEFKNPKYLEIDNYHNLSKNFFATFNNSQNVLILTSINEASYGNEDLFVTFRTKGNRWSEPVNLGNQINTEFDEISPFIAYDNLHLYFSSNRNDGNGGFDLYVSKRLDSTWTKWSVPINLGNYINSKFNETGFSTTMLSDTAFIISSESKVFPSNDDIRLYDTIDLKHGIYKICLPKEFQPDPYLILTGKIYEYKAEDLVPLKDNLIFSVKLNSDLHRNFDYDFYNDGSNYVLIIPSKSFATININAKNYDNIEFEINTDTLNRTQVLTRDFILEPINGKKPFLTLFYEIDVFKLNLQQKKEIDFAISKTDNKFQKRILIVGYADELGTEQYNDTLSYKRALKVKEYLIKLGYKKQDIDIIAKGEKEPIDKEAALNRRTEIYLK